MNCKTIVCHVGVCLFGVVVFNYVFVYISVYLLQNKGKGRLKYLLQQTEIFAHFAKSDQASQKKTKGKYVSCNNLHLP